MIDEKERTIQFLHVADGRSDALHSAAFHTQVRRSPYNSFSRVIRASPLRTFFAVLLFTVCYENQVTVVGWYIYVTVALELDTV